MKLKFLIVLILGVVVFSACEEDEYGDYALPKRRILGRLAARHNTPKGG